MSDLIFIPVNKAQTLASVAKHTLQNKCELAPTKKQTSDYVEKMKKKGYQSTTDVKKKDIRWWALLRQVFSKVIVIEEHELPACPAAAPEEKPQPKKPAEQTPKVEPKPEKKPAEKPAEAPKPEEKKPIKKPGKKSGKKPGKKPVKKTCPFGQTLNDKGVCQ
jgi:hypothetical protein